MWFSIVGLYGLTACSDSRIISEFWKILYADIRTYWVKLPHNTQFYEIRKQTVILKTNINFSAVLPFIKKTISIKSEHRPILKSAKAIEESQESLLIWTLIRLNGHIFTSTCAIETKSVDFFIQTTDKTMGKICFFFGSPLEPKILLESYGNQYQNYHWTEIQQTEIFKIFSCNEIDEKLLYFKAGSIEYVTKEPNVYGRGQ